MEQDSIDGIGPSSTEHNSSVATIAGRLSGAAVKRPQITDALTQTFFEEWARVGYSALSLDAVARKLQDEWSVLGRKITDSLGPDSAFNRNMTEFDNKVTETIRKTADNISAAMARRKETEARSARDEAAPTAES